MHYDGTDIPAGYDPLSWYQQEAQYHIDKDWGGGAHGYGLEYHYCIDRSGTIYRVEAETAITWNATNANDIDLAIKVDSGPNTPPTEAQYAALQTMLDWLTTQRSDIPAGRADVYGHGELTAYGNSTDCPGVPMLAWVQSYRAVQTI